MPLTSASPAFSPARVWRAAIQSASRVGCAKRVTRKRLSRPRRVIERGDF